jgi:voltage-gated potassium channel
MTLRRARRRAYEVLARANMHDPLTWIVHTGLIFLIVATVAAEVLSTVDEIGSAAPKLFVLIEVVALVAFTIEYLARIWAVPEHPLARGRDPWRARLSYARTPGSLIDLAAIAPIVLSLFSGIDLKVLILVRLLRFLKLARYSTGFQSLFEAMRRERHALLACLIVLGSVVLIAASAMYAAERDAQPEQFSSIPAATWWAITTVTTVGYGDVVPHTPLGRLIGGITMIAGLVMLALPVAIIATAFSEVIQKRSFIITVGMITRSKLFAGLDAAVIAELVPMLRAMTLDHGESIFEPGESALYVIADGEVELEHVDGKTRLRVGDAFGRVPHFGDTIEVREARAASRVRLLALDARELDQFLTSRPDLAEQLKVVAANLPV